MATVDDSVAEAYANKYDIIVENMAPREYLDKKKLLTYAVNAELEHGSRFKQKYGIDIDITHDDLDITMKIVMAHLIEDPWYYYHLEKMEKKSEKYWKNRKLPQIIKNVVVKK
jgi:cytidylate kinase